MAASQAFPPEGTKRVVMEKANYRVYGYRWVVLAAYMLVNLTVQLLWIAYAPVTAKAAAFYGSSELQIGFFSMVFMLAFLPFSIPISWLIDRFGFYPSVAVGSVIVGACGILRGLAGPNFGLAFAATVGMAAAQPFFLNSWTKVSALWFPAGERATAVGLVTLANLVGTALGLVVTPILVESRPIPQVQLWYGIAAAAFALVFIVLAKEKPATPPDASAAEERALMLDGLKHALSQKPFRRYLFITFVGLGIFNGITTWVEGIVKPRGLNSEQAGILGAIMLVAGVIGAVALPALSDKFGKRKPFIIFGLAGAVPGLAGLVLAPSFPLLALSSFMLGFFLVSVNPTGTQYASEIALPTPEGTSNGLISLAGQLSVVLVYIMEPLKSATGSYALPLFIFLLLLCLAAGLGFGLVEKPQAKEDGEEGMDGGAEAAMAEAGSD
jgi:MFS family permease